MTKKKKPFWFTRVDVQVSLLVALITFAAIWVTFLIFQAASYQLMVASLEQRVYALYHVIQRDINMETFYTINNSYDTKTSLYQEEREKLLLLKEAASVSHLYTAKKNVHDKYVFVIDGLNEDNGQFRRPGDSILGDESSSYIKRALLGEHIIGESIIQTDSEDIFLSFLPLYHDTGTILGVVGIEFAVNEISQAYQQLKIYSPAIMLSFTFLASILSNLAFRRISNPFYLDLATRDAPTGLKNRNSFEVDLNNFVTRADTAKIGIIMIDLNHLKTINDRYGHSWGDDFLRLVSDSIIEIRTIDMIGYRTGGDEFVVVAENATEVILSKFAYECAGMVKNQTVYPALPTSISVGWAIYDPLLDKTLKDTLARADIAMYHHKRQDRTPL